MAVGEMVYSEQIEKPGFIETLDRIKTLSDPNQQLDLLIRPESLEEASQLVDFAADDSSSPSLLVRAQALELAVEGFTNIKQAAKDRDPDNGDSDFFRWIMDSDLSSNLLLLNSFHNWDKGFWLPYPGKHIAYAPDKYEDITSKLAVKEGIDAEHGVKPAAVFMILEDLAAIQSLPHRLALFPHERRRLLPLALGIHETINPPEIPIAPKQFTIIKRDSEKYIEAEKNDDSLIVGAYLAVWGLQSVFPEQFRNGVRRGAHSLVANSAYAVAAHAANGYDTDVKVPLPRGGGELPLRLRGDDHQRILRSLMMATTELVATVNDEETIVTEVVEPDDYHLYRLWSQKSRPQASVYIRPEGARDFDDFTEHGKRRKGVEASINYIIDPSVRAKGLLHIGRFNRRGADHRLSIRLDREGVAPGDWGKPNTNRDPLDPIGTLSLDIGSVFGRPDWLGTKIGRFLAWGNFLRAEALGLEPQLNHAPHYFEASDGRSDIFASAAKQLIASFDDRRTNGRELQDHLSGLADLAA